MKQTPGAALFTRLAAGKTALGDVNAELAMPPVDPRRERMDDPQFDTGDGRVQEQHRIQATLFVKASPLGLDLVNAEGPGKWMSAADYAQAVGISLGAARKRLYYAKQKPGMVQRSVPTGPGSTQKTLKAFPTITYWVTDEMLGIPKQANVQWDQILQRFPKGLQEEIKNERPDGDPPSIQELSTWWPRSSRPVEKSMQSLLSKKRNLQLLARASDEAIAAINQRWGLAIKPAHKRFDANPQRHMDYSRMPAATAKPSVLVNGEILWGCGRFIAALVRGDKSLWVWDIENSKRAALFTRQALVKQHTTPPVGAPRLDQRSHLDEDLKDELNPTKDDPDLIRHTTGVTSAWKREIGRLFT